MNKITLGISSCLLGNKVRYDGGHKLDPFLTDTLGNYIDWVPVCPEAACGLGIPREILALEGDPVSPRLRTVWTGIDQTSRIQRWAKGELKVLADIDVSGYVFKARSPSCGVRDTKVFDAKCRVRSRGPGLFARAVMNAFPLLPVEDEERMHDPAQRENFIVRVFVYRRWQEYIKEDGSLSGLVSFHTDHKYLIMAHSQKHYSTLGKMVADAKKMRKDKLHVNYISLLMEGLLFLASPKKNVNVLQHMAGYFKDKLSTDEKKELLEVIVNYHDGLVPLIVPMTLLRHYVRKYKEDYLARQVYLNPHPLELMLRNHV
jgi:uncharacterized protein YbgA (DUF1722 family)/uncharacterized protein YbbK (DUF523 family)